MPTNDKKKNKGGFSLIEVLVSTLIFTAVMVSVVGIYSKLMLSYQNIRSIQRNTEEAGFAMNLMAKSIRTSSVLSYVASNLDTYDYSQQKCIRYHYSGTKLQVATGVGSDVASCGSWSSYSDLTAADISNAYFSATPTSAGVVGRVTIALVVCAKANCAASNAGKTTLQTTVSLRN